jgi:hypothetical protein
VDCGSDLVLWFMAEFYGAMITIMVLVAVGFILFDGDSNDDHGGD